MSDWANFFVAQVGASAALAGLLFVGISINMTKIVAQPALPNRALQGLALLVAILVIASLLLVPGIGARLLGVTLLVVGASICAITSRISREGLRRIAAPYRRFHTFETSAVIGATSLYAVAGAVLLAVGRSGVYLLVPAFLVSILIALVDAWVLLVEINR